MYGYVYTSLDEEKISEEIRTAIRLLIILRRHDAEPLLDGDRLYDKATDTVNRAIDEFEQFYKYAYEDYYNGKHKNFYMVERANNMAIEYNLMLDLCEPNSTVSNDLVYKYWGNALRIIDVKNLLDKLK